MNYDFGKYEDIDKDGYSYTQGEYIYNWDDSEYRQDEEEQKKTKNGKLITDITWNNIKII